MKQIFQIYRHELGEVLIDKGILIFILFVPLMYPLLYSWVYTNEVVRQVPVAVVDDDHSERSRELWRKWDATPDVTVVRTAATMSEAQLMMQRREVYGILHIDRSFSRTLVRGEEAYVGFYGDLSSMLYYKAMLLSLNLVAQDMNRDIKIRDHLGSASRRDEAIQQMPIDYVYQPLYNPQSGFAAFLIPPVLMLILQQTLLLGMGMGMGRLREQNGGHVMPAMACYEHTSHILLARTLIFLPLYLVMALYAFVVVTHAFTLPELGHWTPFLAFVFPYLLACIGLGGVLAEFVYRREDCILLFVFLSVPLLFLSGLSWPGTNIGQPWRAVSWLFPSTFGMNAYTRVTAMGATVHDILPEIRALWAQPAVYYAVCFALTARHKRHYQGAEALRQP